MNTLEIEIKNFYKEITNHYITIKHREEIKLKYKNIFNKSKKSKTCKQFHKDYKNLNTFIEKNNNDYIKNKREKLTILNNINGYSLDEYQSKVVLSEEQNTLVIAGAGSGKSLTIIGKIIYLVKCCNINPQNIICISFTNDATDNLNKNIRKNYNIDIHTYTFHKLALHILQQNKIEYDIAPTNLLDDIIDLFFTNYQHKYEKTIQKIIKTPFTENEIHQLKQTIKTFINLFKSNGYRINEFPNILKKINSITNYKYRIKEKNLLLLIINIYLMYEKELKENNFLDFNDMINKCINSIDNQGLTEHIEHIIIDEYQDTSKEKFLMIQKIIEYTNAKLLVVGDDFQSIYRFTGCDLQMFLEFPKYFPNSTILPIISTYRSPQELINVAGAFIMKNKKQMKKKLISSKHIKKPIKIIYTKNKIESFKKILEQISPSEEIMVLGRNNKDINNYIDKSFTKISEKNYQYKEHIFTYLTMHKSKGLESSFVILLNVDNTINGLPTTLKEERIMRYITNSKEYYPYEEERRLFYVALTRTKNIVYILSSINKESIFIKEIKKYKEVESIHEKKAF